MKTKEIIKKEFDCVQFVRKERERIAKDTEGKKPSEVLKYFKRRKETQTNKS